MMAELEKVAAERLCAGDELELSGGVEIPHEKERAGCRLDAECERTAVSPASSSMPRRSERAHSELAEKLRRGPLVEKP
jgi:hypothetical protein